MMENTSYLVLFRYFRYLAVTQHFELRVISFKKSVLVLNTDFFF